MFVNAKVDIEMSNVYKPESEPREAWYIDLEESIRKAIDADRVEIVDISFFDETPDELEIDW